MKQKISFKLVLSQTAIAMPGGTRTYALFFYKKSEQGNSPARFLHLVVSFSKYGKFIDFLFPYSK